MDILPIGDYGVVGNLETACSSGMTGRSFTQAFSHLGVVNIAISVDEGTDPRTPTLHRHRRARRHGMSWTTPDREPATRSVTLWPIGVTLRFHPSYTVGQKGIDDRCHRTTGRQPIPSGHCSMGF